MKKQFIIALAACLAATISVAELHAQRKDVAATISLDPTVTNLTNNNALPVEKINVYVKPKVMRNFMRYFNNVSDVLWSESNNRYLASFNQDGRACKAIFENNGTLAYCIHYGTENSLPKDIRRLIKSEYVDFNIGAVSEVDANNTKAWFVNIEDADNLIVVRYVDGNLDEWQHFATHSEAAGKDATARY